MKMQEVSKRYARALFEVTLQVNKTQQALNELKLIEKGLGLDNEVLSFFSNPMTSAEVKLKVLTALLDKAPLMKETVQFLKMLVSNHRIGVISSVVLAFQELLDEAGGVVRGRIKSAQPLSDETKQNLTVGVSKAINKKVIFDYVVDKSVIGGVVADVQGLTFDDSLQNHLNRLNEELNRRRN